jgi:3-dehydroquinate synthase
VTGEQSSGDVTTVRVALRRCRYDIAIGAGLLTEAGQWITRWCDPSHVVIITDENVIDPYAKAARASLQSAGRRCDLVQVAAGEATKSIAQADRLWNQMLDLGADRRTVVVAVGGGVVGDLAGFIAATYARGLQFVQAPTTLLAHVDSSVGGKVGVNLPRAKNMVGAFWQPAGVLIDTDTLRTLPPREFSAGMAEVVKYGVIMDPPFFEFLEREIAGIVARDAALLRQVIAKCCHLKADVVQEDERETTGRRAILNYGHTFCHAIESVTEYGEFLHGEAVAIGMICASRLAEALGRIDATVTARQLSLLQQLELPTATPENLSRDELLEAMRRDKKVEDGKLRFVLPDRLGRVELVSGVDQSLVRAAWDA